MFNINNLNFSYGDHAVFNNFSFALAKEQATCLVGKNGSGKTTLFKILCGLNYCPDLDCSIDGFKTTPGNLKGLISFVPANPTFYELLTVNEYIMWIGSLWKMDKSFQVRAKGNLHKLNLSNTGDAEISTFSLGMKYKLYFGTFLALKRPILLLDEPFNALDVESREVAIQMIKNHIQETHGYCLFSSHVTDTIAKIADAIITL